MTKEETTLSEKGHGPLTPEETEDVVQMVRDIGSGKSDGFIAVARSTDDGEHTRVEGRFKATNFSPFKTIETIFSAFGMSDQQIQNYLMMKMIQDKTGKDD